jgi:hypothetical protein
MFQFKFELWVHQIDIKDIGRKYLEVWNPENHDTIECTVNLGTLGAYRQHDLDLRMGP